MSIHVHVCRGLKLTLSVLLNFSPLYLLRWVSLTQSSPRCLVSASQFIRDPLSLFPELWGYSYAIACSAFTRVPGALNLTPVCTVSILSTGPSSQSLCLSYDKAAVHGVALQPRWSAEAAGRGAELGSAPGRCAEDTCAAPGPCT